MMISVSVFTYKLIMTLNVVVSNLSVSILLSQIVTEIPSPVEITETIGVFVWIRGTFDEIVNHKFEWCVYQWSTLEVSNSNINELEV
jgi:hypothetical protein